MHPERLLTGPFRALLTAQNRKQFFDSYVFDVRPVSDDAPFFFYTVQPRDLWAFFWGASKAAADYKVNLAIPLLFGLVAISLLATAVILALPPVRAGEPAAASSRSASARCYFSCLSERDTF